MVVAWLDLDGDVVNAETLMEHLANLGEQLGMAAAVLDDHVGGKGVQAGGDGPDVQVVDAADAGRLGHAIVDFVHVDAQGTFSMSTETDSATNCQAE